MSQRSFLLFVLILNSFTLTKLVHFPGSVAVNDPLTAVLFLIPAWILLCPFKNPDNFISMLSLSHSAFHFSLKESSFSAGVHQTLGQSPFPRLTFSLSFKPQIGKLSIKDHIEKYFGLSRLFSTMTALHSAIITQTAVE